MISAIAPGGENMLVKELKEFLNKNPQYDNCILTDDCKYSMNTINLDKTDNTLFLAFNIDDKSTNLFKTQNTYLMYAECDHDIWWFFVKGDYLNDAFNYLKQIVEKVESSEEMIKKLMCSYYPNIVRYAYVPNSITSGYRKFTIEQSLVRIRVKHLNSNIKKEFKTLEHIMSYIENNNLEIKDLKFNEDEVWFEVKEPSVQAEETKDNKIKKKR